MLPFHKAVEPDFTAVNALIISQLHSDVGLVENIGHYIVDSGGKRLRPLLVLLMAKCLGYQGEKHIELATIIEFIHTATLLHDDVVDISHLRRGRPTANAEWGNAPCVLVGDFLYSRSFQMLVKLGSMPIMGILSDTTNTLSEGEVQQLINAKDPEVSEANYFSVIYKKTAALFEAACEAGAVLAGAEESPTRQAAKDFGQHLGLAFQLIDDALDYEGSAEELGKNVGDDLSEGKPTLPLIYAMANAATTDQEIIRNAIREGSIQELEKIVGIVKASGGLDYTHQQARKHASLAKDALQNLPDSPLRKVMSDLVTFSIERRF